MQKEGKCAGQRQRIGRRINQASEMIKWEGGKQEIIEIEEQWKNCMKRENQKKPSNQLIEAGYAMHSNGIFLG
jgi:hypothetical protein